MNQQIPLHKQEQQHLDESASKLIAKLTNKIMKQKKELSSSREGPIDRTEQMKSTFKPRLVMPTATTMSSLSDPSADTSPWVTDEIVFDSSKIFNDLSFNGEEERVVMVDSTWKYANSLQEKPTQKTITTLQDLQKLLKEMKDLNGIVKQNSNVLQAGIEDIALEIKERSKKVDQENSTKSSSLEDANDETLYHCGNGSGENSEDENILEGENRDIVQNIDEKEEIATLKKERTYYRSEAESLRLEMKGIKEQLSEIRKILPQVSFNHEGQYSHYLSSSDENDWDHHQHSQMVGTSIDFPQTASSSIIASTTTSTASVTTATSRSIGEDESIGHRTNTPENCQSSDTKSSFRSEIRQILASSNDAMLPADEKAIVHVGATEYLTLPKSSGSITSYCSNNSINSVETQHFERIDYKRPPSSSRRDPPLVDEINNHMSTSIQQRQFRGRVVNAMKKQVDHVDLQYKTDPTGDYKKPWNTDLTTLNYEERMDMGSAKNCYNKQWEMNELSETTSGTEQKPDFVSASKKYRQLRRSLQTPTTLNKQHSESGGNIRSSATHLTDQLSISDSSGDEHLRGLEWSENEKWGRSMDSNSTNGVASSNQYCDAIVSQDFYE